jgi:hypothetical protein
MNENLHTIRELKKMASSAKVPYYGTMNKKELVDSLGLRLPWVWYVSFLIIYLTLWTIAAPIILIAGIGTLFYDLVLFYLLVTFKKYRERSANGWGSSAYSDPFEVSFGYPSFLYWRSILSCFLSNFPKR